jgi:hypothetical protein
MAHSQKRTPTAGGAAGANQKFSFSDEEFHIAEAASQSKARLRYLAERLHALGEKPLYHFLTDLERGETLTEDQVEFQRWTIKHGVSHSVAYSLNEALAFLDAIGCLRKIGGRHDP